MVAVLVGIVIVAIVFYLGVVYLQRANNSRINTIEELTAELENNSQEAELAAISKLNLTGESLTDFDKIDKEYRFLVNKNLPTLVEQTKEIKEANQRFNFFAVHQDLKNLELDAELVLKKADDINAGIKAIRLRTREHQKNVNNLRNEYQDIRKKLLAKNFSYGPAIDRLENDFADLEKSFKEYNNIAESGDYVKAAKILISLKKNVKTIQVALQDIPPLYKNLHNVFPKQIEELEDALERLESQKYKFTKNVHDLLANIDALCDTNLENIKILDLPSAKSVDSEIVVAIDEVYTLFESEYTARNRVEKKVDYWNDFLKHAEKQQHELVLELDRLEQNYVLNHNENDDTLALAANLKKLRKEYTDYTAHVSEEGAIYSQIWEKIQNALNELTEIEKEQKRINDSVSGLWKEEKQAWTAVNQFGVDILQYRREIEKLNLPGLSKEYLDYYYRVSDEIDALYADLNHVKIDIDEITKNMIDIQSDLDSLEERTTEIIDSSRLTEEMLQYSNRYRNRYPEVLQAYQDAKQLFEHDYDYVGALDAIAQAVDTVEPGAYQRIADRYKAQKR
ncbi:septation ring formation regulator EzrA [Ligilactobacillus sp. WILCCON 0076]|uniref:Septation ring formation regulator EzrA n=1 Tax=Ligilactobacillus ubinensis TaxID=2876789 RepID=A0A9X2FL29_9LACO|nr:septation ring formation regulator EzrA [Ligilactobacillus ubinensis]MCP0887662.1 septation ring formation regulator EzrA [Ligilactobacillus ubinensis]